MEKPLNKNERRIQMHDDFRLNLIRMTLLKEAKTNNLHLDQLDVVFDNKGLGTVSRQVIHDEMEHLQAETYLKKLSATEYQITSRGQKEIDEVLEAIELF